MAPTCLVFERRLKTGHGDGPDSTSEVTLVGLPPPSPPLPTPPPAYSSPRSAIFPEATPDLPPIDHCETQEPFWSSYKVPSSPSIWNVRLAAIVTTTSHILWVMAIYLLSELLIWGLSAALSPLDLQFFASILGMTLVFLGMVLLDAVALHTSWCYASYIKHKVDFINANLGIGFAIPVVMVHESNALGGREIGLVVASFVLTNIMSWPVMMVLSLGVLRAIEAIQISPIVEDTIIIVEDLELKDFAAGVLCCKDRSCRCCKEEALPLVSEKADPHPIWPLLGKYYPCILALTLALILGAPIAAFTGDMRVLDGLILWFVWISSLRTQQAFKGSTLLPGHPKLKRVIGTLLNAVLFTTLLMMAYMRLKDLALPMEYASILDLFSKGTPLYALWTSLLTRFPPLLNPTRYFGAGDLALSILECGIVIWGFKLYECRRQLSSVAGLATALLSIVAAVINVFIPTYLAAASGLDAPEAISFGARSVTLALAKPAMEAAGGNLSLNAALVVSNGILGQIMYPFVLGYLPGAEAKEDDEEKDDPVTVALGVTIGVNGAAMGVAYLYETKHRAAPYAALSMTVFGVMTVVLMTVEPFQSTVAALAGRQ